MSSEKFDEAKKFQGRLREVFLHFWGKERGGPAFLARKAKISPGTISEWMNDLAPTAPDQASLRRISDALKISFEWLATGNGSMFAEERKTRISNADLRKAGQIVNDAIKERRAEDLFSQPARDSLADLVGPGVALGLSLEEVQQQVGQLVEAIRDAKLRKGSE